MMVLLLLDSSAIEVVINYTSYLCAFSPHAPSPDDGDHGDHGEIHCEDTIFNKLSNSNMESTFPQYRNLLRICGFIGQLLLLLYFRDNQIVMSKTLDERNCTISDYSIMVSGIPKGERGNEEKIRAIFNKEKLTTKEVIEKEIHDEVEEDGGLNVQEILLLSNLEEYYEYEKELAGVITKRLRSLGEGNQNINVIYEAEEKEVEGKIKHLTGKIAS